MLVMKTLGVVLIMAGFGGGGLYGARRIERRVDQLRNLRLSLLFLQKEISCLFTPLSRALERTAGFSDYPVSNLFLNSAKVLKGKDGVTATEAWLEGTRCLRAASDLKAEDINLLNGLGAQLGMSDAAEQKRLFDLLEEELRLQEDKARTEMESGRKLWSYGGFILGSMVILLLI